MIKLLTNVLLAVLDIFWEETHVFKNVLSLPFLQVSNVWIYVLWSSTIIYWITIASLVLRDAHYPRDQPTVCCGIMLPMEMKLYGWIKWNFESSWLSVVLPSSDFWYGSLSFKSISKKMANKVAMKVSVLKMKSRKVPRAQTQDNWKNFKILRRTSQISFGSKILTTWVLSKLISEEERKEKPILTILWTTAKLTSEEADFISSSW